MPDPFPTDTHPADDLDLDEVGSDFAFGHPCDIPPGIVGDATRLVFDTHWPALLRAVQAYRKRVDTLEAALVGERTRYDACAMALGDCGSRLMAARRDSADWREIAEARDADVRNEAHPPVVEYRIEQFEPGCVGLPSRGWGAVSSAKDTAEAAVEAMRARRERRSYVGPMRVVRLRETHAVVAVEDPTPAEAVPPPAGAPAEPDPQPTP